MELFISFLLRINAIVTLVINLWKKSELTGKKNVRKRSLHVFTAEVIVFKHLHLLRFLINFYI